MPEKNVRIALSNEFKLDLQWWNQYADRFNGVCTLVNHHFSPGIEFSTDSSTSGYGAQMGEQWIAGYFNSQEIPEGVEYLNHGRAPLTPDLLLVFSGM